MINKLPFEGTFMNNLPKRLLNDEGVFEGYAVCFVQT